MSDKNILYDLKTDIRVGCEYGGIISTIIPLLYATRYDRAVARKYQNIWLWGRSPYNFDEYDDDYLARI